MCIFGTCGGSVVAVVAMVLCGSGSASGGDRGSGVGGFPFRRVYLWDVWW